MIILLESDRFRINFWMPDQYLRYCFLSDSGVRSLESGHFRRSRRFSRRIRIDKRETKLQRGRVMAETKSKTETSAKQTEHRATQASTQATEISKESIAALGAKLDQFGSDLSEDEQITLATAFALAGRGFSTFPGATACEGGFRVGIGGTSINVEQIGTTAAVKLSQSLADAFCPASASRFSIEGLEVEKTMVGAKSVAASRFPAFMGAKSVAAGACRNSEFAGAKSVAAARCQNLGMAGAKSVAAARCQNLGMAGAKSVAAGRCQNMAGAKSVAACQMPWMYGNYRY